MRQTFIEHKVMIKITVVIITSYNNLRHITSFLCED